MNKKKTWEERVVPSKKCPLGFPCLNHCYGTILQNTPVWYRRNGSSRKALEIAMLGSIIKSPEFDGSAAWVHGSGWERPWKNPSSNILTFLFQTCLSLQGLSTNIRFHGFGMKDKKVRRMDRFATVLILKAVDEK